jgi:hypothetical protein
VSIFAKLEAKVMQAMVDIYTGKKQASPDVKAGANKVITDIIGPPPAPAPAPAPAPIQLAPVMDLVSTIMKPKPATGDGSPTGGDGANKQAYGGDIATLRPVANAGDSGGTMLTGPVGVDPEALLLAKKTLLGA